MRKPPGDEYVIRDPLGIRGGAERTPPAVGIARYPIYLFTKIGKNNRALPGRAPYATLRVLNGLFTGCRFDENAGKVGISLFDTPAPVRVVRIVPAPVKSEGSRLRTVRKWPKFFTRRVGPGSDL